MPRKSWWARLPFGVRMAAGSGALLVLLGGGVAGAAVLSGSDGRDESAEQTLAEDPGAAHLEQDPEIVSREAAAAEPLPRRHVSAPVRPAPPVAGRPDQAATETAAELTRARAEDPADRTGSRSPRTPVRPGRAAHGRKSDKRVAKAEPVVTTRTDTEIRPIPFRTRVVRDDSLPRGFRKVQAPGVPGEELVRYLVTLTDGKPSARRVLDTTVTRQPRQRVVVFGVENDCDDALDLCVPLGRAGCPSETAAPGPDPAALPENGSGPLTVTDEDLLLFDPDSLADVRLEPATVC